MTRLFQETLTVTARGGVGGRCLSRTITWAVLPGEALGVDPAVYRDADGLDENGGVLRGLATVLAEQAAIVRRSSDRLWDDQSSTSATTGVPYIGDLLGTRMVSSFDKRGRRVDVANTIYYRAAPARSRAEGMTADLNRWEGTAVEEFRHLLRHPHGSILVRLRPAVHRNSGTPAP